MNVQIVKKDDIQNNLIANSEHMKLWNDYKKLRIKLDNHYATLKLLAIKVFKINTTKGYHVQNKKLKFICKKGQSLAQDTWFIRKLLLINLRSIEIIQRLVQENHDLQDLIDRSQEFAIQNMRASGADVFLEERNFNGQLGILVGNCDPKLCQIAPIPYNFGGKYENISEILRPQKSKVERNDNVQSSLNMLTMVADSLKKFADSKKFSSMMTNFNAASIIDDLEISFGNFECFAISDSSKIQIDLCDPTIFANQGMLTNKRAKSELITSLFLESSRNCTPSVCESASLNTSKILIQDDELALLQTIDLNPFRDVENIQSEVSEVLFELQEVTEEEIPNFEDELPAAKCRNTSDEKSADFGENELLPILQSEKQRRKRAHEIADEILRTQWEFLQLCPTIRCHSVNLDILNCSSWMDICSNLPNVHQKLVYEVPEISHPKKKEVDDFHLGLTEQTIEYIDIGIGDNSVSIFNRECQVDEQVYIEIIEEVIYREAKPVHNDKWAQKINSNTYERRKNVSYHDHKKSLQNLQDIIQSCKKNSSTNSNRTFPPATSHRNPDNKFGLKKPTSQAPRIPKKTSKKELNPRTEVFWQNVKSQGSKLKQKYPGIPDMSKVCQIILQGNRSTGVSFQFVRSNKPNSQMFAIDPYRA